MTTTHDAWDLIVQCPTPAPPDNGNWDAINISNWKQYELKKKQQGVDYSPIHKSTNLSQSFLTFDCYYSTG